MDEKKLIEYITNNLTISIDKKSIFGPSEVLEVKLELDGEEISTAICYL